MMYTCKDAWFTLSVISQAQNEQKQNRNNANTCKVKYILPHQTGLSHVLPGKDTSVFD